MRERNKREQSEVDNDGLININLQDESPARQQEIRIGWHSSGNVPWKIHVLILTKPLYSLKLKTTSPSHVILNSVWRIRKVQHANANGTKEENRDSSEQTVIYPKRSSPLWRRSRRREAAQAIPSDNKPPRAQRRSAPSPIVHNRRAVKQAGGRSNRPALRETARN